MNAKGFGKLLELARKDEVTRVFSNGVTPDNINYKFNRHNWRPYTLLALATSLKWNTDDLEIIRCLLTMGAKVTTKLLARVTTQKQLRVILDFGVDSIKLCSAFSAFYSENTLMTFTARAKDLIMYGGVPYIHFTDTIRIFVEKVERRVNNCRRSLLTLILCIQQKYKPLKWLIRQFAMRIWSLHPFCNDLVTPSAGPRSNVWDWNGKSGSRPPSKKQKC